VGDGWECWALDLTHLNGRPEGWYTFDDTYGDERVLLKIVCMKRSVLKDVKSIAISQNMREQRD
jgi:hypothetical protein